MHATLCGVEAKEVRGNSTGRGFAEIGPVGVEASEGGGVAVVSVDVGAEGRGAKGDSGGGSVEETVEVMTGVRSD